jgi:ubiquitin-conjugating enzyme E2 J1
MTPNGRFEANREICLSISGHHEETWQPAWGIRTAVVAYVLPDLILLSLVGLCLS